MPFVSSVRGNFGLQKKPFPNLFINNSNSSITGGTITTGGGYRIHTFTSGTSAFAYTYGGGNTNGAIITFPVEVLVVAGGGSGGGHHGGGGGGGGVVIGTLQMTATSTDVVVGSHGVGAGAAVAAVRDSSYNGGNSSIGSVVAIGGGAGQRCCGFTPGVAGGSSGGWGAQNPGSQTGVAALQTSGTGYTGYGNAGGGTSNPSNSHASAGGGGAGSVGGTGIYAGSNSCRNGNGGNGVASSLSGSSVTYAGGGGGGQHNGTACWSGGLGGSGGGGNGPNQGGGSNDSGAGVSGTDGLGGGGGGDSHTGGGGTRGGSGVVIMRYLI